ncbi:MAG: substrate-binding domain-containing protein, partial [Victivallales bacterium]
GMNNFAQRTKEAVFREAIGNYALRKEDYRILLACSVVPFEETYRKLLAFHEVLKFGKTAMIVSSDKLACTMTESLIQDGFSVPGDIGVAATDGLSVTISQKPKITTLKVDTIGMGVSAMNLLLHEIAGNNSEPCQNKLFLPNLVFGETI